MREKILAHLQSGHYQPAKVRGLARFFDVAEETYPEFRALIKAMIREGQIEIGPRGKLRTPREPPAAKAAPPAGRPRTGGRPGTVRGRFSLSDRGFGFVIPDAPDGPTGAEDIFIGPNDTLGAVTNDTVLAEVKGKSPRGYYGRIAEIVERGQTRFVGTFYPAPGGGVVRPDGGILSQDFAVPDASSAGARPKDKVVFEVLRYALRGEPGEAVITKVLGQRGAPGVDTLCIIHQFDLPLEFPEEVLAEARAAAARMNDDALEGRRDLTRETIITIDPADARDFDDAISLSEHADGTATLGVHIADVPYFVPEDSALDREARERGTSVYLPTMVVPMLPEVLSNGVCSLQEGRTRLTKSAFIRIDPEGEPVGVELANSFIRSAKRLTYEQATAALEGETGGLPPEIVDLLRAMERLARRLLARRQRQGYLELDLPKVDLEFNEDGCVVAAHPEDTSFSHKIIEMFMVEANEAVARELQRAGLAFMRRIHPEPDDEAAEDLMHYAKSVGHVLHNSRDRRELQRLLAAVRGRPEAYGIHLVVLKSLERAVYSIKPEGHYALASEAYCHFTSPIRRYPDLTVHRQFDALVQRGTAGLPGRGEHRRRSATAGQAGRATASPAAGGLAELAIHCSRTERRAEAAERELTKVKLLEYLQTRLGDTFTGVITGVQAFGVFVENSEFLIDGLVHISRLQDDQYQFDRKRWALVGRRTGRVLRIGSTLEVQIAGVNIPRRELDLEPVVAPAERARQEQAAKARKNVDRKSRRKDRQAAKAEKWAKRGHNQPPHKKGRRKGRP
jgi:ribonuclease R